jgi:hypothetical protein
MMHVLCLGVSMWRELTRALARDTLSVHVCIHVYTQPYTMHCCVCITMHILSEISLLLSHSLLLETLK